MRIPTLALLGLASNVLGASAWSFPPAINLAYRIDANELAKNCEYFVETFGAAFNSRGEKWLEGVIVPKQIPDSATVLGAGAFIEYSQTSGGQAHHVVVGKREGRSFLIAIPYTDAAMVGSGSASLHIESFNIFVDVRDSYARIIRFWAVTSEEIWNLESVFWGYPYTFQERGSGSGITYTHHPSPIMRLKKRCVQFS